MSLIRHTGMAVVAAAVTLLLLSALSPTPVGLTFKQPENLQPALVEIEPDWVRVEGRWYTLSGVNGSVDTSIELRCSREHFRCNEAYMPLMGRYGRSYSAKSGYSYQVIEWNDRRVFAVASAAMGGCIDRMLTLDLNAHTASLAWQPSATCEGAAGHAELVDASL